MAQWTRIGPKDVPTHTHYGELPLYDEGLYDLGQDCYAWMTPNGSWGESNAGLIVGEGQSLLVETLWDVPSTRRMLEAMQPLTATAPIRTLVNTHADGDHFFGNQLVDAEIITSQAALAEMRTTTPQSLILLGRIGRMHSLLGRLGAKRQAQIGRHFTGLVKPWDFKSVKPKLPTRTFGEALTLTIGGRIVQLIKVGPAHTHGDLMVYVPDAKVLYAADVLFINSTPVMWAGPAHNWLRALDRILALDVTTIVPGHGPVIDKNGVLAVKAYWVFVSAEIEKHFHAGLAAPAAARAVVHSAEFARRGFVDWNSPERIMVSAHTIYRNLTGRQDAPKIPELLSIMRQQALLANELPNAQPQVMRVP